MRIVIIDQFSITPYVLDQLKPVFISDFEPPDGKLYNVYIATPPACRNPKIPIIEPAPADLDGYVPDMCTTVLLERETGSPLEVWKFRWDTSG